MRNRIPAFTIIETLLVLVLAALLISVAYTGLNALFQTMENRDAHDRTLEEFRALDLFIYRKTAACDSVLIKANGIEFYRSKSGIGRIDYGSDHCVITLADENSDTIWTKISSAEKKQVEGTKSIQVNFESGEESYPCSYRLRKQ